MRQFEVQAQIEVDVVVYVEADSDEELEDLVLKACKDLTFSGPENSVQDVGPLTYAYWNVQS